MAKKIEPGDRLLMELPVVATWPDDGKVTVVIAGTRFTIAEDNDEIRQVLKAATAKAKAARGGEGRRPEQGSKDSSGRVRIGGSALARIFDEGRG